MWPRPASRFKVGRVWRPEQHARPDGADRVADGWALVGAEIVHDHDVAGLQGRHQKLLDIGPEAFAIDRPIENARHGDLVRALRAAMNVSVRQWPCGTLPMSRRPRVDQQRSGAMLVLAHVSSMNTRRRGSRRPWYFCHRRRRRSTSGRSCSLASTKARHTGDGRKPCAMTKSQNGLLRVGSLLRSRRAGPRRRSSLHGASVAEETGLWLSVCLSPVCGSWSGSGSIIRSGNPRAACT